MKMRSNGLWCLLVLLSVSSPTRAGLITSLSESVNQVPSGLFDYSYILNNDPSSDSFAVVFAVNVAAEADLQSFATPFGWDVSYTQGSLVVTWEATDPDALILPGASGVFGFSSALAPSTVDYAVLGFDPVSFDLPVNLGQTLGPAVAVPEPSTVLPLATGLLGLLGYAWQQRKPAGETGSGT